MNAKQKDIVDQNKILLTRICNFFVEQFPFMGSVIGKPYTIRIAVVCLKMIKSISLSLRTPTPHLTKKNDKSKNLNINSLLN
jgi:hypothetical protein